MILTKRQIQSAGLVSRSVSSSFRSTTYDATIERIISDGEVWGENTFVLPKRGVVWVVSKETFKFGETHTGLATLKTTWTHKGLLALNVGVIDPGWDGPLATALVNFSNTKIPISVGDPFFRVLFFEHEEVSCKADRQGRDKYVADKQALSGRFSTTFLDMHSLVGEVAGAVFKMPSFAFWATIVGLVLAVLSIFGTMAFDVWGSHEVNQETVQALEDRIEDLEKIVPRQSENPPPAETVSPIEEKAAETN